MKQPISRPNLTQAQGLVLLVTTDHKRFLVKLLPGAQFHCHLGVIQHDDLMDKPFGSTVLTAQGRPILLLDPSLSDLMTQIKRGTQIIYPKDAAYLVHRLSLRDGSRVVEAGSGSGGLTTALAWAVASTGVVYTYEMRPEVYQLARRNLERTGLLDYVQMFQQSIEEGFRQTQVDALFLDVRQPWNYFEQVRATLRPGGHFGSLVPTTNQVSQMLRSMEQVGFADIAVEELLLRRYKTVPDRLRPEDQMVAHTGFLIFGRLIDNEDQPDRWLSRDRQRYAARLQAQERNAQEEARRRQEQDQGGRKYPRMPLP